MRPGLNGELILEGETEARVAAHFLIKYGAEDIVSYFEPPVSQPHIGRLDFLSRVIEDKIGTGDTTEHAVNDPGVAELTVRALTIVAIPDLIISFVPRSLKRQTYLSRRITRYREQQAKLSGNSAEIQE